MSNTGFGIDAVIIVRVWRFEIFNGKGRLGFHFMESLMRPRINDGRYQARETTRSDTWKRQQLQ